MSIRILAKRHGASSITEHESACADRFPLPILPPVGEGENESLRDFHGNENFPAPAIRKLREAGIDFENDL